MIKRQFTAAIDFYKKSLNKWTLITYIGYWALVAIVIAVCVVFPEQLMLMLVQNADSVVDTYSKTTWENNISTAVTGMDTSWLYYLIHNGKAAGMDCLMGIVPFIPVAPLFQVVEAVLAGGVIAIQYLLQPVSLIAVLSALVPHGIVEIYAFAIATAIAMYICRNITRKILHKDCDDWRERTREQHPRVPVPRPPARPHRRHHRGPHHPHHRRLLLAGRSIAS